MASPMGMSTPPDPPNYDRLPGYDLRLCLRFYLGGSAEMVAEHKAVQLSEVHVRLVNPDHCVYVSRGVMAVLFAGGVDCGGGV